MKTLSMVAWREDLQHGYPTINTIATTAIDENVYSHGIFWVDISHVLNHKNERKFMAVVRHGSGSVGQTGSLYDSFERAYNEGCDLVHRLMNDIKKRIEQDENMS